MKLLLSVLALTFFASPSFADSVKMNFHVQINLIADASNPNQFNTESLDVGVHVKGKVGGESVEQSQQVHQEAKDSTLKSILVGDGQITQIDTDGTQTIINVKTSGNKIKFSAAKLVKVAGEGASASVSASRVECTTVDQAMTCSFDATMNMSVKN